MKGTDKQRQIAADLRIKDWNKRELEEAARGFTMEEYEQQQREKRLRPDRAKNRS